MILSLRSITRVYPYIVIFTICCTLVIQRVNSAKKEKGNKPKRSKKTTAVKPMIEALDTNEELEMERIKEQALNHTLSAEVEITLSTPDWNLLKRQKLANTKRKKYGVVWQMVTESFERSTKRYVPRLKTGFMLDNDVVTEKLSKRALKRMRTTNWSSLRYYLDSYYIPTVDPRPFIHENVIVNAKNVLQPSTNVTTGSVIFLHGEGIKAGSMKVWINSTKPLNHRFKHLRFVFPTSPYQPFTPCQGDLMYVWFDRPKLSFNDTETLANIDNAAEKLMKIIRYEMQILGLPTERIIIGGYGMGGTLALHMAYRYLQDVAGVFVIGGFLNEKSAVYDALEKTHKKKLPPVNFIHGDKDVFVPIYWARKTFQKLRDLGVEGEFRRTLKSDHKFGELETHLLYRWITKTLPDQ